MTQPAIYGKRSIGGAGAAGGGGGGGAGGVGARGYFKGQVVSSASYTQVSFSGSPGVYEDALGLFDIANSQIVFKQAGWWVASINAEFAGLLNDGEVFLEAVTTSSETDENVTTRRQITETHNGYTFTVGPRYFNANETLKFYVTQNGDASDTIDWIVGVASAAGGGAPLFSRASTSSTQSISSGDTTLALGSLTVLKDHAGVFGSIASDELLFTVAGWATVNLSDFAVIASGSSIEVLDTTSSPEIDESGPTVISPSSGLAFFTRTSGPRWVAAGTTMQFDIRTDAGATIGNPLIIDVMLWPAASE